MRIGIIGAMDEEIESYLCGMNDIIKTDKAKITFYQGEFKGRDIVLCKSGVGKVNSAVCTQILLDNYEVKKIIFTGVAGALDPKLEIGDIVLSTAALQYDIDATSLGFEKGVIPYADKSIFTADKELVKLAEKICNEMEDVKVFSGLVLSGDKFIADSETSSQLYQQYKGLCTEMEGAAVAQVCYMNDIPFLIVRTMSDKANHSAEVNFIEFAKKAADRSYLIVDKIIELI